MEFNVSSVRACCLLLILVSNDFPHSTFNWVGLDGSQVLTHMTPVNNYNSQSVPTARAGDCR